MYIGWATSVPSGFCYAEFASPSYAPFFSPPPALSSWKDPSTLRRENRNLAMLRRLEAFLEYRLDYPDRQRLRLLSFEALITWSDSDFPDVEWTSLSKMTTPGGGEKGSVAWAGEFCIAKSRWYRGRPPYVHVYPADDA